MRPLSRSVRFAWLACPLVLGACGHSKKGDTSAYPRSLPFTYERPASGDPVSPAQISTVTEHYLDLLTQTHYFDVLNERVQGWPRSDPQGRYWYGTWWSGVTIVKSGGKVAYVHPTDGSDNIGMRTAPLLETACYAYRLWGDATSRDLVRRMVRGFISWNLAMVRWSGDDAGPMLTRAAYPPSIESLDGGQAIWLDYDADRPGIDADPSEYVHLTSNPTWGDIWIKNKRSKDDIGHMLRAIGQLDSCAGYLGSPNAEAELQDLWKRYSAWARKVEDDGWAIATLDKSGKPWIPPDALAHYVTLDNIECDGVLALRLIGRGDPGSWHCGNGLNDYDKLVASLNSSAAQIMRSNHEAAANMALRTNHPELARPLLAGLASRIDTALDRINNGDTAALHLNDVAALIVHAATVGVPLTWREVRWLDGRIELAYTSYLDPSKALTYQIFDSATPDGSYAYEPVGDGFAFNELGLLLGLCSAEYRNPASEPVLDCNRVRAWR